MPILDEAIHQAARWLSEVWSDFTDARSEVPRHVIVGDRYGRIARELTRLAQTKPPEHQKMGYSAPIYRGPGDLSSASVTVFDTGVVYGYLQGSLWPDFAWPAEAAQRMTEKRKAAQNPSRGASPSS